ncbi:MAG: 2OG-Fe(II) oxygenase [Inquilinaceae bacterium]
MFHFPIPTRPPIVPKPPPFVSAEGLFTPEELTRIDTLAQAIKAEPVVVGSQAKVKPEYNRSEKRSMMPSPDHLWIYHKIANAVSQLNAQHFRYDITGIDEPLYHVTYRETNQGHYHWHADVSHDHNFQRKLSITFQMSDGGSYAGGDLEINANGQPQTLPRNRGQLLLFPSHHLHRVSPVTRGVRSALVAWIVGPPFR